MKDNRPCKFYLTVGDLRQKELCESVVSETESRYNVKICVVSDDGFGCRIGSGGAVLNIIKDAYEENEKIIIINSGGMSKRIVNFALKGKVLACVENNGKARLMLDLLIENALRISECTDSGVLVCCSDIPVDTRGIKDLPRGNVGFCIATNESVGSRHGVLFTDENSQLVHFAHKKLPEELKMMMSKFGTDTLLTDTGWIFLDAEFCRKAKKMCLSERLFERITEKKYEINLYSDIIPLLSTDNEKISYFASAETDDEIKEILYRSFSGYGMKAFKLENQQFLHFGSIREYLTNAFLLSGKKGGVIRFNSCIDESVRIGSGTVLDTASIKGDSHIGDNCFVSDVSLSDVTVPDEKSVFGFRQKDGSFVTAVCDVDENPKMSANGMELWEKPRFYKGKSFSESYLKFVNGGEEQSFSLRHCIENADHKYLQSFSKYLKGLQSFSVNKEYSHRRERLLNGFFKSRISLETAECVTEKVEVALPVRINLSGTWTDAMPYCVDNGGEVINAAVTVEGCLPIRVTAEKLTGKRIEFISDSSTLAVDLTGEDIQEYFSDFNLHFAVLKTMGIDKNTALKNGFRLTTRVTGLEKGSGLGTSSILLGGCFMAMGKLLGLNYSKSEIIRMVFVAEQIMNTGGGWQDQTGALFQGIKISSSEKGEEQNVSVREIRLSEKMSRLFDERAVLVPTGERHFGRFIVGDVADRYLRGVPEALEAFEEMKLLNRELEDSFEKSDEERFFCCLNRHCELLERISPKIINFKIKKVIARLREETEAVSICGAGAGGYLLTFLKTGNDAARIKEILKSEFPQIKGDVLKVNLHK